MKELVEGLYQLRSSLPRSAWEEAISVCGRHGISSDLQLDPLTQRSFKKPRGYAGDAVMLDMVYGYNGHERASSEIGKAIFAFTAGSSRSTQAVRHRRSLIATCVDETAREGARPRILSIASGHLREAALSQAFHANDVEEWIAMDSDQQSLLECSRSYGGSCVRLVNGSVRQIASREMAFSGLDFVYAAGLFDYLNDSVAKVLISRMFEMLRPGGKLMISNFVTDFVEAGYMEAFMGWWLTYRSQREMRTIAGILSEDAVSDFEIFTDPMNSIVYATAQKR